MDEQLNKKLQYIHLNGLRANWENYLEVAHRGNYSHSRLLEYIIDEEYKIKQEKSLKLRLNRAKIPEKFAIETFPFSRQPKLNKKKLLNMYDSLGSNNSLGTGRNIIWIGPTGVGKTGLATAFLIQAIHCGYTGRFILFPDLVEILYQSIGNHSEGKVINTFASYDFLLIDELGYIEVESSQVALFFTLMQKRHKKNHTLITSNLGFNQWASFLKNVQLTAALIDRLTEISYVINMKECVSLRTKFRTMSSPTNEKEVEDEDKCGDHKDHELDDNCQEEKGRDIDF